MTPLTKRFGLLAGATLVALSLGGAYIAAQDTSGAPGPFMGRGGPGRFGGPGGRGGPGGPMGMFPMLGRLNLTDAQREQVKSLLDSHRDETRALADKSETAHQALAAAVSAEQFDESAVRVRSADVAAVDADMAVLQARIHGEIWQILTPDQQKQARDLQTQMQQRRQDHQGGRTGGQAPR
jgi:periplasmic protein CpxP/Spy